VSDEFEPGLYVVATPIGHPEDLSPRAARCLACADVIAAEDTRVARTLLGRLGLHKRVLSYYEHNEESRIPELLAALDDGQRVALISDAGTPLLSDPGYRLVRAACDAGVRVAALPGPSAALAALVVSGLPTDRFTVVGFLPRRGGRRAELLRELGADRGSLVLFEAPQRIVATLRELAEAWGPREAAVAKSLTKPNEQVLRGTLEELADRLATEKRVRGELTLVVQGAPGPRRVDADVDRAIDRLLAEGLSARTVRDVIADAFALSPGDAYERVLRRKEQAKA
jgi:16S rRNA (cytidine1402-2'-O)-methyltransferase